VDVKSTIGATPDVKGRAEDRRDAQPRTVTALLVAWADGEDGAEEALARVLYPELHRLAVAQLLKERPDHTLQPTALVHEAYLRLVGQHETRFRDRVHFFGIASRLMRQVLVDHARRRRAARRGGGERHLAFDERCYVEEQEVDLLALDEALGELERLDADRSRVIELRFFGGLGHREIAELEGVSLSTIERRWRVARAWLFERLAGELG